MVEHPHPAWHFNFAALVGLCGLATAAVVHLGTYFGTSIQPTNPLFFILHLGIFPLFFLFIIRARRWSDTSTLFGRSRPALTHWSELKAFFPQWIQALGPVLFGYTMINFIVSIAHLPSRGSITTPDQAIYVVRAFSGHWLLFYAVPTFFFGFVPKDAVPRSDDRVST